MPMNGFGGLFGAPAMWGATKPYQQEPFAKMGMAQQQPMPEEKKGGGFFGDGGAGRAIAGSIGDYLLQASGMRPIYAPAMQQRRQAEERQRLFEQQRKAGLEDYRTQKQIDQEYAAPPKPNEYQLTLAAQNILPGTPEYAEAMQRRQEALLRDPNSRETMFNIPGFGTFFGTIEQAQQLLSQQRGGGMGGGPSPSDIDAELKRRGVI